MEISKAYHDDGKLYGIKAVYNNRTFTFHIDLCREFANYYKGALTQQRVEAILPTAYGSVLVYGLIDELMPTSVHDIKTTGSYTVGKFKDHHQHLVYPYALMQNGSDVRIFEYNIVEFNKGGYVVDTYTETYVFNPERDIPILTNHCEEFIRFLEENRELITDKKILEEKINGKPNNRTDNRNWTNRSNTIQKRWFLIYKTGVYFRCYYLRPLYGRA